MTGICRREDVSKEIGENVVSPVGEIERKT